MNSPYDLIASEYYDAERHPTCANFAEASFTIVRRFLDEFDLNGAKIVDVGCGRSIVAQVLEKIDKIGCHLTLVDQSLPMLQHSSHWIRSGAWGLVANAEELPFMNESIDIVIAATGDPFNTQRFWNQMHRILRRRVGRGIFTTPSYEWASAYRTQQNHELDWAVFTSSDHGEVVTPSFVYTNQRQEQLITDSKLRIVNVRHHRAKDLGINRLSRKLYAQAAENPIIMTSFEFENT